MLQRGWSLSQAHAEFCRVSEFGHPAFGLHSIKSVDLLRLQNLIECDVTRADEGIFLRRGLTEPSTRCLGKTELEVTGLKYKAFAVEGASRHDAVAVRVSRNGCGRLHPAVAGVAFLGSGYAHLCFPASH